MKKFISLGLLTMCGLTANSQYYDYTTAAGWSPNIQNLVTPPAGCPFGPLYTLAGAGDINITGGVVLYNTVYGAHESRISTFLGNFYDKEFNLDVDFKLFNTPDGKAINLAVLTSQDVNPDIEVPMITCNAAPNMDQLGIRLYTPGGFSDFDPRVAIGLFDNGSNISPANYISIQYNVDYYARVKVYGNEHAEFFLYDDPNRTKLVGSFCFDVPKTIMGLGYLQHTTLTGAGYARNTHAIVETTNIYETNEPCCKIDIHNLSGGGNVIIGQGTTGYYSVSGVENPYITVSPNVDYYVTADGILVVTNWGPWDGQGPKIVTITVRGICQCEEIVETKTIYVYPRGIKKEVTSAEKVKPSRTLDGHVRVYPNPVSGAITVEHSEPIKKILLIDPTGKVLEELTVADLKTVSMDLSARPMGLYTLKIITENQTTVEQVIKK